MRIFIFTLLLLMVVSGCKHKCKDATNPECDNYDPCTASVETKADFVIESRVGNRYFVGDSVHCLRNVRFRALQDADSFVWKLGSETIRSKEFVRRNFPQDIWIPVQLTIYRKSKLRCKPDDDGVDTAVRSFYVWPEQIDYNGRIPKCIYYPIYGTFRGQSNVNPQPYYITLHDTDWWDDLGNPMDIEVVKNIPYPSFDSNQWGKGRIGWRIQDFSPVALWLNQESNYFKPFYPKYTGYAYLDPSDRDRITVETDYVDSTGKSVHNVFKGVRVK